MRSPGRPKLLDKLAGMTNHCRHNVHSRDVDSLAFPACRVVPWLLSRIYASQLSTALNMNKTFHIGLHMPTPNFWFNCCSVNIPSANPSEISCCVMLKRSASCRPDWTRRFIAAKFCSADCPNKHSFPVGRLQFTSRGLNKPECSTSPTIWKPVTYLRALVSSGHRKRRLQINMNMGFFVCATALTEGGMWSTHSISQGLRTLASFCIALSCCNRHWRVSGPKIAMKRHAKTKSASRTQSLEKGKGTCAEATMCSSLVRPGGWSGDTANLDKPEPLWQPTAMEDAPGAFCWAHSGPWTAASRPSSCDWTQKTCKAARGTWASAAAKSLSLRLKVIPSRAHLCKAWWDTWRWVMIPGKFSQTPGWKAVPATIFRTAFSLGSYHGDGIWLGNAFWHNFNRETTTSARHGPWATFAKSTCRNMSNWAIAFGMQNICANSCGLGGRCVPLFSNRGMLASTWDVECSRDGQHGKGCVLCFTKPSWNQILFGQGFPRNSITTPASDMAHKTLGTAVFGGKAQHSGIENHHQKLGLEIWPKCAASVQIGPNILGALTSGVQVSTMARTLQGEVRPLRNSVASWAKRQTSILTGMALLAMEGISLPTITIDQNGAFFQTCGKWLKWNEFSSGTTRQWENKNLVVAWRCSGPPTAT